MYKRTAAVATGTDKTIRWGTGVLPNSRRCDCGALLLSWTAMIAAVFFYWIAGSLGIGMGFHRLLTHRGYYVPKVVEYFQ